MHPAYRRTRAGPCSRLHPSASPGLYETAPHERLSTAFVQAQAVSRKFQSTLRSATVKAAPVRLTSLP
jgi:hypothetical protein